MPIRFRIPLPGPFVYVPNRRRSSSGVGLALFTGLVILGFCFEYPLFGIVVAVFVLACLIAGCVSAVRRRR